MAVASYQLQNALFENTHPIVISSSIKLARFSLEGVGDRGYVDKGSKNARAAGEFAKGTGRCNEKEVVYDLSPFVWVGLWVRADRDALPNSFPGGCPYGVNREGDIGKRGRVDEGLCGYAPLR